MSTDVSVSEDVSSSGALSHRHASPDGDGGKESETSLVSSEATSASGLAISEDRHRPSQTKGGTVDSRPMDISPACNKIRSLCLSTNEAFEHGRNLPFINPSSLETLRALVQEIQNSGETNPEIWKDCEGRWLHLFQLVEKQYQEQILAQQEQYQCQIQLIQDEIKALVQLQNRQASIQSRTEFSPTPVLKTTTSTKDCIFPVLSNDCRAHKNVASENDNLAAPAHTLFSSHSLPLQGPDIVNQVGTTGLSSGYGTLSAWGTCLETAGSPREDEDGSQKHHWHSDKQNTETTVKICQQDDSTERTLRVEESNLLDNRQSTSRNKQTLTSWAQRQKHMAKKSKAEQASSQNPEYKGKPSGHGESVIQNPPKGSDSQEQERPAEPRSSSFPLMRSDSLISQASGLTYWRLNENELYHPLPDSFDSGAYLLLQEASMNVSQSQEPQLSLKEIYENKQRTDSQRSQGEGSVTVSLVSSQLLTLDPSVNQRQSDRTSGFTSPSHFSSPSFTTQPHLYPRVDTPLTPDSMVECSPNLGDTDGVSDASSVSAVRPSPSKGQSMWGNTSHNKTQPCSHTSNQQCRASAPFVSEEEGSHTHTSTLKPRSSSGATLGPAVSPHMEKNSSLEDPVVLSLLRQNLREKHARHVADLKAYYESEIQLLKDKLKLEDLPQDIAKANQALTKRCKYLEKALSEATKRIKELEAGNISLEKKLAEWPERYAVAGATVKSLQQRLEESQCSEKEKEALVARLKSHIRQLEESAQKACREENEKEARMEREYKMLQDLLGEYDSLGKEHERLKKNLVSTENKLFDANDQISELKRVISKLESQVKQLEHESQARARFVSHSNTQPSGAGLFHHPDLLPSPGKGKAEPDITRKKSPCPPAELQNGDRKSQFLQKNQSHFHKNQSSGIGCSINTSPTGASWSCPSECEQSLAQHRHQELSQRRETSCAMTPMMRALIELEETRATESRAPWVSNQRTTVGFVESRHKEAIHEPTMLRKAEREDAKPAEVMVRAERGVKGGAETAAARLRAQRSLSPESYRSSSLPPAHRSIAPTTPTKRKTLIMPLSAKSSPKRCPTENYSTAFGCLMPREEHLLKRFDGRVDQRRHSFQSSSPRKRLHFTSADREDVIQQPESSSNIKPPDRHSQQTWEEQGAIPVNGVQISSEDSSPLLLDRLHSLAEAEKLFDELTQEKLQIEAALNRMPRGGGKMSLQTRLDEVALESRLERVNRELGSIRMTLKRFHVLRSTANI